MCELIYIIWAGNVARFVYNLNLILLYFASQTNVAKFSRYYGGVQASKSSTLYFHSVYNKIFFWGFVFHILVSSFFSSIHWLFSDSNVSFWSQMSLVHSWKFTAKYYKNRGAATQIAIARSPDNINPQQNMKASKKNQFFSATPRRKV